MADLKLTDVAKTYGGTVDVLKNINMVEAAVEAVGENDDLKFIIEGAKDTGINVNTVKEEKKV